MQRSVRQLESEESPPTREAQPDDGFLPGTSQAAAEEKLDEQLTARNVRAIAQLEEAARSERTPLDRIIDLITGFCGSMSFVYAHTIWFGVWILWNIIPTVPKSLRFDPYPFQLLTLVVSLEAIFLSTFILISQNRQSLLGERRNHLDLQVNLLAEQESTKTLALLERLAQHLNLPSDDDPEMAELERATRPEQLVQEIEHVIERSVPKQKQPR